MPQMNHDQSDRWGIMGGVFDPIHIGHLVLAENASRAFNLSNVLFVVSNNPPHRNRKPNASYDDRIHMTALAIEKNEIFSISDIERDFNGSAYTLNVVIKLKELYPEIDWHLILGADNITMFDSWHQPDQLIREVRILVGSRPGFEEDIKTTKWYDRVHIFDMPLLDISSTQIRERIGQGVSIRYLVPENVREYILEKGLYK